MIRVCLIEDDVSFIEAAKIRLEKHFNMQFSSRQVATPDDLAALPLILRDEAYHVLLVDLDIPGPYEGTEKYKNGLQLIDDLIRLDVPSVCLVLTATKFKDTFFDATRAGAVSYIEKATQNLWGELPVRIEAAYANFQTAHYRRQLAWLANQITHDLKTPLTGALLAVELMSTGNSELLGDLRGVIADAAADTQYLHEVLQALAHGNTMVRKVCIEPSVQWSTVFDQLKRRANLFASAYTDSTANPIARLCYENTFNEALPLDAALLRRAVFNLVINALEAMRKRRMDHGTGRLEFYSGRKGEFLQLVIKDNVGGLPPDIFDKTLGLGLHISREIVVEVHRGKLEYSSDANGTEFIVLLPLK